MRLDRSTFDTNASFTPAEAYERISTLYGTSRQDIAELLTIAFPHITNQTLTFDEINPNEDGYGFHIAGQNISLFMRANERRLYVLIGQMRGKLQDGSLRPVVDTPVDPVDRVLIHLPAEQKAATTQSASRTLVHQ